MSPVRYVTLLQELEGLKAALSFKERECASQRAMLIAALPYVIRFAVCAPTITRESANADSLCEAILRHIGESTITVPSPKPKGKS